MSALSFLQSLLWALVDFFMVAGAVLGVTFVAVLIWLLAVELIERATTGKGGQP